jgi:hypothetical protein
LNQYKLTTGLNIVLDHPIIVLKERPYTKRGSVEVDLGQAELKAETKPNRDRKQNDTVFVTSMNMRVCGFNMNFIKDRRKTEHLRDSIIQVLEDTNLELTLEQLNFSPALADRYLSPGFDFQKLDISQHLTLQFTSALKLRFTQEVFTYLMRCNDLNISFTDKRTEDFQLAIWNDTNTLKYLNEEQETVRRFKGVKDVYKQKIRVDAPAFSISLMEPEKQKLIAELCFWNFSSVVLRNCDRRQTVSMQSHSIQILRPS